MSSPNNPFGALAHLRDALPAGPAPTTSREAKVEPRGPARAVVRMERKGRGGKEVTVIEQLGLPAKDLATWLKALKGSLGCGGVVEGDALVLQGDHRERVKPVLEGRGVRKVTLG
jgi:translation initiation factor 1